MPPPDPDFCAELLEALSPLLGLIHAARTLSPGKVGVLRAVEARGRATASDLAGSIGLSQQAVSLAAKELEAAGYLERRPDADDRRRVWLHLTSAGVAKLDAEKQVGRAALQARIDAALTPADRLLVAAALPALRKISPEPAGD